MSIASTRVVTATFSGEGFQNAFTFTAGNNASSPGATTIHTLSVGANTITIPTGGSQVQAATIIPPTGNTSTLTVKGTTGDTGIAIHKTDPTSLALDTTSTTQTSFVITVGVTTVTGLHIVWT